MFYTLISKSKKKGQKSNPRKVEGGRGAAKTMGI
jgi:hypothetical protein